VQYRNWHDSSSADGAVGVTYNCEAIEGPFLSASMPCGRPSIFVIEDLELPQLFLFAANNVRRDLYLGPCEKKLSTQH
jgi:hypothetical protein